MSVSCHQDTSNFAGVCDFKHIKFENSVVNKVYFFLLWLLTGEKKTLVKNNNNDKKIETILLCVRFALNVKIDG